MVTTTAQHGNGQCCQNLKGTKLLLFFFLFVSPTASNFKVAQFLPSNPISQIQVLFSYKMIKITQLGRKTIR